MAHREQDMADNVVRLRRGGGNGGAPSPTAALQQNGGGLSRRPELTEGERRGLMRELVRDGGAAVQGFGSPASLREADRKKWEHEPRGEGEYVYLRDDFKELVELEGRLSRLIGIHQDKVVAFATGMTAITTIVEMEAPATGDLVMYGNDTYGRVRRYLVELERRGVKPGGVDTLDTEAVGRYVDKFRPKIIALETVANGPNGPVLDLDAFFSLRALSDEGYRPLIILDNTGATPTLIPPTALLRNDLRVVVVEAGMKFYTGNGESLGLAYSNDKKLLWDLREERRTRGGAASLYQVRALNEIISFSKAEFDERNRTVMRNNMIVARACYAAQGDGSVFTVWHPNLPDHPNSAYANAHFPKGAAPFFHIQVTDPAAVSRDDIAMALGKVPEVVEGRLFGHSFGGPETRLLPEYLQQNIRVSAGIESGWEIRNLASNIRRALDKSPEEWEKEISGHGNGEQEERRSTPEGPTLSIDGLDAAAGAALRQIG